jgi:hypothetical protein
LHRRLVLFLDRRRRIQPGAGIATVPHLYRDLIVPVLFVAGAGVVLCRARGAVQQLHACLKALDLVAFRTQICL